MSERLPPEADAPGCDDASRYPTLGEAGRAMLQRLVRHPHAPVYRNRSGNRLTADDLREVLVFESQVRDAAFDWTPGRPPAWLDGFVRRAWAQVPYYRALGAPPARFEDVPCIGRGDLAADVARFVPDDVPAGRLINFRTTGTTGQPLLVPSHPQVAARYLAFHKRALRRFGIEPAHGAGQVGVVLLGFQRRCFTYVSVTPAMGESGLAKINLHPDDWRDPGDRARYMEYLCPEFLAGDPISFAALLSLPVALRPRALLSVSMALSPALRDALQARFGCPVLDLYSLNEVGPVAVHDPGEDGQVLLQPGLYVEVVDEAGRALPSGGRGEIAVTGGFNFCLPLLRYRTGDFGTLRAGRDAPVIDRLAGRRPVRFRRADGDWCNNIDVTHALARLPLSRYALHQHADGGLALRLPPDAMPLAGEALAALAPLFADAVRVEPLQAQDKCLQYGSDLPGALA